MDAFYTTGDPESQVFLDASLAGTGAYQAAQAAAVARTPPPPPKANAIKPNTIVAGLVDALNKYQAEISGPGKDKPQEYPDHYNIVLVDQVLRDAKVVPPGQVNLKQTPMTQAQTANQQKNPATQKVNNDAKTSKIVAGTSIVKFLDDLVRSSTYIYDQQIALYDPKTGKLIQNGTPAETIGWYRIGLEATPQPGKFDTKRNDWAYDITYSVNIFAVTDVKSDFFPTPKARGTHKKYRYWFTGENTQVLDFYQDYNYLYYIVSNGPNSPQKSTSNQQEVEKRYYQVNSPESSQGQDDDKVNEPSANAADYLYSPGDQGRVSLKIVGDPAWIFQGETWSGIQGLKFNYGPFLTDGTINYEGQEVLFELSWNNPVDYDLETGVADPTGKNYKKTATSAGDPQQKFTYLATECISHFSKGRFDQELKGVLKIYPIASEAKAVTARPVQSTTITAKVPDSRNRLMSRSAAGQAADPNGTGNASDPYGQVFIDPYNKATPVPSAPVSAFDREAQNTGITTGAGEVAASPRPAPAARPATSSGQIVDPEAALIQGAQTPVQAETQALAVAQSSGQVATGTNQGQPVTQLVLTNSGQTVYVTSQDEIKALYDAGQITRNEQQQTSRLLSVKQIAANQPTTNRSGQLMRRES